LARKKLERKNPPEALTKKRKVAPDPPTVYPDNIKVVTPCAQQIEEAFESQCTIRQVAALVGITTESLRIWGYNEYLMPLDEVRDMIAERGIAKFKILINRELSQGNTDYHRIYGKMLLEDIQRQSTASNSEGEIVTYCAEIPDNGR
jgi:hypothetical protein